MLQQGPRASRHLNLWSGSSVYFMTTLDFISHPSRDVSCWVIQELVIHGFNCVHMERKKKMVVIRVSQGGWLGNSEAVVNFSRIPFLSGNDFHWRLDRGKFIFSLLLFLYLSLFFFPSVKLCSCVAIMHEEAELSLLVPSFMGLYCLRPLTVNVVSSIYVYGLIIWWLCGAHRGWSHGHQRWVGKDQSWIL